MEYSYNGSIIIPQYSNSTDRENNDLISELYSILFTINSIEKFFIKSSIFKNKIEKDQYANSINELLSQWNSIIETLDFKITNNNNNINNNDDILLIFNKYFENSEIESLKFGLRRIKIGINGIEEKERDLLTNTKENENLNRLNEENNSNVNLINNESSNNSNNNQSKKEIAEATSSFITLMDAIKLNYDSKDTLHPLFSDVLIKSGKISNDFEGRSKLVSWLIQLNKMPISDSLNDNQLKEMLWDVNSAYTGFFDQL